MNKTIFQVAAVIFLAFYSSVMAQELPKIMPPSPEAASVFKSSEVPISFYTGVPNITIPIFDIEARGLTIPVNLSYHARGVQVGEIASQAGLGWSLNYGGMISRQIRGSADEGAWGYLGNDNCDETFFGDGITTNGKNYRAGIWQALINYPEYDLLPDQFFFNANSLNGKFIFDQKDGTPVIQQFGNTRIAGGPASPSGGFTMTDGSGNKYYFGVSKDGLRTARDYDQVLQSIVVPEIGSPVFVNPHQDVYYNTWHLMDIETAQGELIKFFYELETYNHYSYSYDELYVPPASDGSPNAIDNPNIVGRMYKCHLSQIQTSQNHISEIRFDKGRLAFSYSANGREDLPGASGPLTRIALYDKLTKVKEFDLGYDYKTSPDDSNQNWYLKAIEPEAGKRLFLKSVQEKFAANDTLPAYRFKYNSTLLPNRFSTSQDLWGFYNGKANGPYLKFYDSEPDNRAVDEAKAQAAMLEEMVTPQGGTTKFYYEQNKVVNTTFPESLIFKNPNPQTELTDGLGTLDIAYLSGSTYTKQFTIGQNLVKGAGYINVIFHGSTTGCGATANTPACNFEVSVKGPSDTVFHPYYIGMHTGFASESGVYTVRVRVLHLLAPSDGFNIILNWKESVADPAELLYAAGKRIKKIEYLDAQNSATVSKTYDYNDPFSGKTSGSLLGLSSFYSTQLVGLPGGVSGTVIQPYGAVPGSPMSTYQGNSVGYAIVTEIYGEGNNTIGKTEYRYTMTPDSGDYYEFPYHPPTDNEWLRGKELSITHFKRLEDNSYTPVKKIENKYLYSDNDTGNLPYGSDWIFSPFYRTQVIDDDVTATANPNLLRLKNKRMFRLPLFVLFWADNGTDRNYKVYHQTAGTVDVDSTTVTDYFDNGLQMKSRTKYTYDYDEHYNPAAVIKTQANGVKNTSVYFYAQDTDTEISASPVRPALVTRNMIQMPLLTNTYKNDLPVLGRTTDYKDWGNGLLSPEIIKTSKGGADQESRVRFNAVDNTTGSPLEVQQEDGIVISYLWGYNKTQPIAKIENASNAEIATALGVSYLTDIDETDIAAINGLRASLPNAMATTYTYIPLVGIASITDPKGDTVTYTYDTFNRLLYVKDKDGKILGENQYHYRTQN